MSVEVRTPDAKTVVVPPEFFRAELRVYGNWHEAFARELLQNAKDARPSRVDIQFFDVDGHGRVVFDDDGCGMTRETLENVFFALGRSTKTGGDSIGGFGRARIIICFAQERYQIRTGNLLVTGEGGTYTITEVDEYHKGCQFTIDLIDEKSDNVRWAFNWLLRSCVFPFPISVNGRPAQTAQRLERATRVLRDERGNEWAKVYVKPNGTEGLTVRVQGLTMFTDWIKDDEVVVELTPSRSREVLSASRDSLTSEYKKQLQQFVSDLTRNRRKALRPPAVPLDVHVGGGGFMRTDSYTEPADQPGDVSAATGSLSVAPSTVSAARTAGGGSTVTVTPANAAAYANQAAMLPIPGLANLTPPAPQIGLGFDVYVLAERSDSRVQKLNRVWNPVNWAAGTGRNRRKVLLAWKAAVGVVLDELVKQRPSLGSVLWTVGWTFDTDVEAVHTKRGDGHVLALNPVTADCTARYKVSQRSDRQRIGALAKHEVTHIVCEGHDESFANLLTDLVATVDPNVLDRVMQDAIRDL